MKVLIVPSWYPRNQFPLSGVFFKEQAEYINDKKNIDVRIAYPEINTLKKFNFKRKMKFEYGNENNLKVYRNKQYNLFPFSIKYKKKLYSRLLWKIVRNFEKEGFFPDIIHAHSILWGGSAAVELAEYYEVPLVITEHSSKIGKLNLTKFEKNIIKSTILKSDRIIAVSTHLKDSLYKIEDSSKIDVIPNLIDTELFKYYKAEKKGDEIFHFSTLCFLNPNKGIDLLIKSFSELVKINKNIHLNIGGDGPMKNDLLNLTNKLGIEKNITFTGQLERNEVILFLRKCDVFVLPSHFETFGVVLIEALSIGRPVIATKSGGPESIINKNNGLLVDVNSISSLKYAMLKMLETYQEYDQKKISENCKLTYDKQNVIENIINVYECEISKGKYK